MQSDFEMAVKAIPGSFNEVMAKIFGWAQWAKDQVPDSVDDQIDAFVGKLTDAVGDKITPEGIRAAAEQILDVMTHLRLGPPNPGAAAL